MTYGFGFDHSQIWMSFMGLGPQAQPIYIYTNEMKTEHRSHRHPLTPTKRVIFAVCSACGEKEEGFFFSCQLCNYWIHQNCASLPTVAMYRSHPHALVLRYYDPLPMLKKFSWGSCVICHKDMPLKHGYYNCRTCDYGAHLKCLSSLKKDLTPEESRNLIFRLPPTVEDPMFPSSIIREAILQEEEIDGVASERMTHVACHDHDLTFHGDNNKNEISSEVGVCNACVQPISSSTPYYSCSESQCNFLVHEICTKLHSRLWGKVLDRTMSLFTKWTERFFNTYSCSFCDRQCNGFGYSYELNRYFNACVDVECASAPRIIEHVSHKKNILQLKTSTDSKSATGEFRCCSRGGYYFRRRFYQCISCTFQIHISCALLPKQVTHKFDEHALQLNTDGLAILSMLESSSDHCKLEDHYFCEICEEGIDLRYWFYCCDKCDQYFHVKCIPSVARFSKFKFGGTIYDDGCHPHPVTSVRMLTVGSQICEYCMFTIRGFEDGLAFHCSRCDFWIHPFCMYAKSGYRL